MQVCKVKQGMCNDPAFGCADKNATCHFEVERLTTGEHKGYTFCTCEKTQLTLADRSLTCERKFSYLSYGFSVLSMIFNNLETCHAKCKNSDRCVTTVEGGKSVDVCHCKDGFSGEMCDKIAEIKVPGKTDDNDYCSSVYRFCLANKPSWAN